MSFENDIVESLNVLRNGGIILYPTDTIWGIGCDATNEKAIQRIYKLKQREESKSLIILLADERSLMQYIAAPDPAVFDYLETLQQPTTIIFNGAIELPDNLINKDGSIGIRIVKEDFCRHLVKRLGHPLVSTSANISGTPSAATFSEISPEIIEGVDYVVKYRQQENKPAQASKVVKWEDDGTLTVLRG
ncbi:MAG: threonylcarbamoyl-AMP synthase [Chitinophagaceae bacterium]|nr:threonylcarbamoyl-AMP synthase [Chitinophagaceae bacterium]